MINKFRSAFSSVFDIYFIQRPCLFLVLPAFTQDIKKISCADVAQTFTERQPIITDVRKAMSVYDEPTVRSRFFIMYFLYISGAANPHATAITSEGSRFATLICFLRMRLSPTQKIRTLPT